MAAVGPPDALEGERAAFRRLEQLRHLRVRGEPHRRLLEQVEVVAELLCDCAGGVQRVPLGLLTRVARDLAVDVDSSCERPGDDEHEQRDEIGAERKGARNSGCQMLQHGGHSTSSIGPKCLTGERRFYDQRNTSTETIASGLMKRSPSIGHSPSSTSPSLAIVLCASTSAAS